MIRIATGVARRPDGSVLLVASRYANHAQPLWNLPGGRQEPGELLEETVVREVFEETGYRARVAELAYLGESYDGDVHVLNATFRIEIDDALAPPAAAGDGDHVAEVAWVREGDVGARIAIAVVREPLLAYLRGELVRRYAAFHDAGVTIRWENDPP